MVARPTGVLYTGILYCPGPREGAGGAEIRWGVGSEHRVRRSSDKLQKILHPTSPDNEEYAGSLVNVDRRLAKLLPSRASYSIGVSPSLLFLNPRPRTLATS